MKRSEWLWPLLIGSLVLGVALAIFGDWVPALRPALVLAFMLVCPGMALVRLLGFKDKVTELVLAVALSLALETMLSLGMTLAEIWSFQLGLIILMIISLIGATFQIVSLYWRVNGRA